jgi:hypothetical protein
MIIMMMEWVRLAGNPLPASAVNKTFFSTWYENFIALTLSRKKKSSHWIDILIFFLEEYKSAAKIAAKISLLKQNVWTSSSFRFIFKAALVFEEENEKASKKYSWLIHWQKVYNLAGRL